MRSRSSGTPVAEPEYDALTDETLDHLTYTGATPTIRRTSRREVTKRRIIAVLKQHGNGYKSASDTLRNAAESHFGSWRNACLAAGLEPPKRGRPRKGLQHHITLEPLDDQGNRVYS
jgi:hypothetical protein